MSRTPPLGLPRAEAEALKSELRDRLARRLFPTFTREFGGRTGLVTSGVSFGLTAVGAGRFQVAVRYGKAVVPGSRRKVRLAEVVDDLRRTIPGARAVIDGRPIGGVALGSGERCDPAPMWSAAAAGSYRHRPAPPGAPIAPEVEARRGGSFGSVSCYLKDRQTGAVRMLTCAHVVRAAIEQPAAGNRHVLQAPRCLDGYPPPHRCATVDAARPLDVAVVNPPETALCAPLDGVAGPAPNAFGPAPRRPPSRALRARGVAGLTGVEPDYEAYSYHRSSPRHRFVYKVGARTGWTAGSVRAVLDRLDLRTPHGEFHIDGPILEIAGSAGGHFARCCDSGAPVLTGDGRLLGVVFATDLANPITYAFVIQSILTTWPGYELA